MARLRPLSDPRLRPLGKGWRSIHLLCEKLLGSSENGLVEAPGLAESLRALDADPAWPELARSLPSPARCLIEGITHPLNGVALRDCLARHGAHADPVDAIDICDMLQLFALNGIEMPGVRFQVADATALESVFADATFDLVVLDGLLNCAPFPAHERLLSEASRVARPGALVVCNVTDSDSLDHVKHRSADAVEQQFGFRWDPEAYDLSDLIEASQLPAAVGELVGSVVRRVPLARGGSEVEPEHIAITAPHGRFEFYPRLDRVLDALTRVGFSLRIRITAIERDSNGFDCRRHRLVLQKGGLARS